jgi:plasmid stabilization system protein ParE
VGYGVAWSDRAISDLLEIHDYTTRHLYASSRPLITRLFKGLQRLEMFPRSGRVVPGWGNPAWREIIVPPFRVIYRIAGREIMISRVYHTRRLLPPDPDSFR